MYNAPNANDNECADLPLITKPSGIIGSDEPLSERELWFQSTADSGYSTQDKVGKSSSESSTKRKRRVSSNSVEDTTVSPTPTINTRRKYKRRRSYKSNKRVTPESLCIYEIADIFGDNTRVNKLMTKIRAEEKNRRFINTFSISFRSNVDKLPFDQLYMFDSKYNRNVPISEVVCCANCNEPSSDHYTCGTYECLRTWLIGQQHKNLPIYQGTIYFDDLNNLNDPNKSVDEQTSDDT